MKIAILAFALLLALGAIADKGDKIPQFVGNGYDLIRGNPSADKIDPGFRAQIFDLTYDEGKLTEDEKFLIPDQASGKLLHSCSYSASTENYTGTNSYQKDLQTNVSVSGGYKGIFEASFSSSVEYKKM